ncbi:hypothetical protein TKK_0012451 [Trichogramma kaykai]
MEADGLLGWDIINKYKGVIDAAEQKLMLDNKVIPFFNKDIIDLPPRMRKTEFDNFVGQNRDGWIFAECLNTTEEFLSIPIPWVELIPCETVCAHENTDAGEDSNKLQDSFIFSLATDNAAESAPSEPQSTLSLEGRKKKIFDLMDTEGCSEEELAAIKELIEHNPYVFGLDGEPFPISNIIKCSITTTSEKPFTPKHYRYPPKIKDQMQKEIDKLLKGDIIVKSTTPWLSPLWIVPKKTVDQSGNKKWRFVADFRQLNEMTEGYCHPIPLTVDILERLASANYISCIDLRSGFHQIAMDEDSAYKTGFAGPDGVYQYKRMGMGLKCAPGIFSRAMSPALVGLQGTELEIYLDDVMVHGETLEEHNGRFKRMIDRFAKANTSIEPSKCQMLKKEAKVLGHIVGNGEIKPDPTKIEAMRDYPAPTNPKKVKQFLGLTGYYRRFIKGYATIARPLQKLLRKTEKFVWDEEQQKAFKDLVDRLCDYPVLKTPNFSKPFILTADASDYAIGAILGQGEVGKDHACAYASRCLKSAELRYY